MELRQPVATVGFIDDYCLMYRAMFEDLRLYECFKWLHVGIVSILPRKTLPEIAKLNGLKDGQSLLSFTLLYDRFTLLNDRDSKYVKCLFGDGFRGKVSFGAGK
jgi:hypothetical protein